MADTAAHLVDRVWPERLMRQWVLSMPWELRFRLAYDKKLTAEVLKVWSRCLAAELRRRAKAEGLVTRTRQAHAGSITFVQRFGGALNLNLHFHTLALDGCYVDAAGGAPRWAPLAEPSDEDVSDLLVRFVRALERRLIRLGLLDPEGLFFDRGPLQEHDPLLAGLAGASVRGIVATGERAGAQVEREGDRVALVPATPRSDEAARPRRRGRRCFAHRGFSIHADVAVPGTDRARLERLLRYTARGPLPNDRLEDCGPNKLRLRLKTPWRDGTHSIVFTRHELVEKLVALIPPPRFNLVRYHGVFAPTHRLRPTVVADRPRDAPIAQNPTPATTPRTSPIAHAGPRRTRNYSWADLMRRVFAVDVLECPRCQGPMKLIAALIRKDPIRKLLRSLGIDPRPPPISRARFEQLHCDF
jgi:hypothetical protein